ncbi:MAG: SufD family Fe-S cluster assembly protein [Thermoplasmata archaeon]
MEFELEYATDEQVAEIAEARDEPEWLLKDRLKSLGAFRELPVEPSPLFVRHTDIRGVNVSKVAPPAEVLPTGGEPTYDGGDLAATAIIDEGRVGDLRITEKLRGRDFHFSEVSEVVEERPELARALLARSGALPENDKFGMMSRALFTSAFIIHVPEGIQITLPLYLRWRFSKEASSLLTRTIIHLSRGSSASVIEEFESKGGGEAQSLFGNAAEVYLEDGASLRYAAIERLGDHVVSFLTRQAVLDRDTSLSQALGSFGGFLCKSRADTVLSGQGSSIKQVEVVYGNGKERFDNTNLVVHRGRNSVSDLLSKAVMQEGSRSALKGIITIEGSALNSDSYLGQYSMLLSKKAKSTAIPSLEIKTNDVQRAKHSASVAQVDEEQVFYLMSRGVPREESRRMLVEGFLTPIVDQVDFPRAKERLWELIDQKWVG